VVGLDELANGGALRRRCEEADVRACGIERIGPHDTRQLSCRADHHRDLQAELALDCLLERRLEPGCAASMAEHHVPALHVAPHVLAAEPLDQRPQAGHRHPVARAEVDRAEKRRVRRHSY
jgi:hypothetical protein